MTRTSRSRQAWAAALFVVLSVVAVACGDSESDPDSAEVASTSEPRTLDTGGGEQEVAPQEVVPFTTTDFAVPLEPATYETTMSVRPVRFTIGEGWYLAGQSPPGFGLARTPNALDEIFEAEVFGVAFSSEVESPLDPLGGFVPGMASEPVPDDLIGWYESIPGVSIVDPRPVTVGGIEGTRFELEIGPLPASADCGGARCVVSAVFLGNQFFLGLEENRSVSMVFLGEGAERIVISYMVDSPEMAAAAEEVIESLGFP